MGIQMNCEMEKPYPDGRACSGPWNPPGSRRFLGLSFSKLNRASTVRCTPFVSCCSCTLNLPHPPDLNGHLYQRDCRPKRVSVDICNGNRGTHKSSMISSRPAMTGGKKEVCRGEEAVSSAEMHYLHFHISLRPTSNTGMDRSWLSLPNLKWNRSHPSNRTTAQVKQT